MTDQEKQLNEIIRLLTFAREGWPIEEMRRGFTQKCEWTPHSPIRPFNFMEFDYRVVLPPLLEGYRMLEFGEEIPPDIDYLVIATNRKVWKKAYAGNGISNISYLIFVAVPIAAEQRAKEFPPCPSPHGWHNPDNLPPDHPLFADGRRPLCRDEVGNRDGFSIEIFRMLGWRVNREWCGGDSTITYSTSVPYGQLPPVTKYTFPECAPKPTYLDKHKASGIKVGDLVEVVRPPTKEELKEWQATCKNSEERWSCQWDELKHGTMLGRKYRVRFVYPTCIVIETLCFHYATLRKITMKTLHLDQSDWLTSPVWWVRFKEQGYPFLVAEIQCARIMFGQLGSKSFAEMANEMERSTDLINWSPCSKEVEK